MLQLNVAINCHFMLLRLTFVRTNDDDKCNQIKSSTKQRMNATPPGVRHSGITLVRDITSRLLKKLYVTIKDESNTQSQSWTHRVGQRTGHGSVSC